MEKPNELKFIDHIGEINRSVIDNLNIEATKCGGREYEFYISILKTCQIFTCRFSLCQNLIQEKESTSDHGSKENLSILIKYWKTFYLPFSLVDFAMTKEGIWILGETCYSNIKPYLLEQLSYDSPIEDSLMDVDEDEFNLLAFGSQINLPSTLMHKISSEKFYLKCDAFDHEIVMGSNDGRKLLFNIISSKYEPVMNTELSDITQLLEIPIKPCRRDSTYKDEFPSSIKPVLKLCPLQHTESKSNVLCKLLSSAFPCKNCVGFVSQPNNKICYFLCSWPGEISTLVKSVKLKEIYDMKQPVLGIHVVQNIGGIKGTNVIVVGSLGKIVCLSGKRVAVNERNEEILAENVSLFATTFELSSPVQQHVIFKDYVLYLSLEGKVYCSKFSTKECKETMILVLSQRCILLQEVKKFILLDENVGLFLILTNSGLLHLYEFKESRESETALSLPALMNQAMLISSQLQTLNATKSIQAKFFEAVSIFASMKFRGIEDMKIYFTYSIKNVKNPPRKFIFVDIQGLERYKLESEFWVLSATATSRFEKKCPVLLKTVPLDSENPSICMEIDESIFRSWDCSAHPFILELGFILTLPEKLKQLDCFKLIKKEVPLYCKAKEFILDELSFMETEPIRTVKRLKTSHFRFGDQLMKDVFDMSKKRTIYQLLRPECDTSIHSKDFDFVDSFKLCILQSTAERVLQLDTSDAALPAQWLQGVIRKAIQDKTSVFDVKCRDKTASINISSLNNHLIFNIHSEDFKFLAGLKIAITNLLVTLQDLTGKMDASVFEVSVELRNDCEKLSKELQVLGEQDAEREDFYELLKLKYRNLRTISSKLIYC